MTGNFVLERSAAGWVLKREGGSESILVHSDKHALLKIARASALREGVGLMVEEDDGSWTVAILPGARP